MFGKTRLTRWLIGAAILAAADCAGVAAIEFSLTMPAQAQFFGDDRRPRRSGGFLDGLFGNRNPQYIESEPSQGPSDYSRAPSPRKPDPKAEPVTPTTSIVVLGDGMADWLAYGLEDAFSDTPEIAIIRKNKIHSGLLRYDAKSDLDWWHAARDILAPEKPNYVIMMLGVSDRQNIREKDLAKEADKKKAKDQSDKPDADKSANKDGAPDKDQADETDPPSIISPEPQNGRKANGIIEFRTDQWADIYSRRIDETIAALKSKGVPVFWVGLPSIRGTRSTADAVYLNDLYRARAEKAGAIYIDVWDGFVDEAGKYTTNGPDYEGQVRRLRSGDGVFFTKFGARKLAHYVERELRRYMNNRSLLVSLPSGPVAPLPADGKSAARPLAGPVVPLTVTPGNSDELLGGSGSASAHGDAIATRVLVKGEPVPAPPGRADDFAWPRGGDPNAPAPVAALPANPAAPAEAGKKPIEPKGTKEGAKETLKGAKSALAEARARHRAEERVARPRRELAPPPSRRPGPFDWLR
jgi:hypothetical protein